MQIFISRVPWNPAYIIIWNWQGLSKRYLYFAMAVWIITIFVQTSVFWRHRGSFVLPGFAGTWARSLHPLVSSYGARLRMMKSATPEGCKTVHATSGSLTAWAHWRLFDALSINISRCWLPVRCACWQTHYNNEKWKIRKVWLSL